MALPRKPYTAEIETLLAAATRRRYTAKSRIVNEGETPTEMFFILQGSVVVLMEDLDGHELILSYLGPGEFFGELGFFGINAKRSAYVRVRTDCEIAAIGYGRLKQLMHEQPELLMRLTMQIVERLRATSEKLGHLAFLDVTGRIARALLDLARGSQAAAHPDGTLVRMTREELGRLVNCSPKMVGRVLRNLEEQGLIQVHGKSIVVMGVDPQPPGLNESPGTENSLKTGTSSGK
jgi:CRP/FNR family transcriptional regulator, cyclic AMP receptor protein